MNFKLWQQSECALLGITVEQHNEMVEAASRMNAAFGFGGAYWAIRSLMDTKSMADFEALTIEADPERSVTKMPFPKRKKYVSKKLRRAML